MTDRLPPAAIAAWDAAYQRSDHSRMWDCPWPSPELVGLLAGLGSQIGGTALDLGCGTGAEAVFLAHAGMTVVGVDISQTALELAHKKTPNSSAQIAWCASDVLALPIADASLDLVTDRGCLHHIADTHRHRYASEVARVLRPGGWAFLRGMSEHGKHKVPVTPEAMTSMVAPHDFSEVRTYSYTMVGVNGHVPACLALLQRGHGHPTSAGATLASS